jgi:hypothetical protein
MPFKLFKKLELLTLRKKSLEYPPALIHCLKGIQNNIFTKI